MSETWLVVKIYLKEYARQGELLILGFVKPTVEALEEEGLLETFHFLFEEYFLFRARTQNVIKGKRVKSIIDKNLAKLKETIDKIEIDKIEFEENYPGEQDHFGTEGWLLVQKLLEYASKISLLKRETLAGQKSLSDCHLDREFNDGKLVHCFLNAQGLSTGDEANFHNQANMERLLRIYGFFDIARRLQTLERKAEGGR